MKVPHDGGDGTCRAHDLAHASLVLTGVATLSTFREGMSAMQGRRKTATAVLVALSGAVWLAGCGGGSGGTASGGGTSSATRAALDVYVTDGFTDRYKQVLTTLYKIEVTTDGTTWTTVFSDDAGRSLNLSSLSDTAELIASLNVAAGTYTKARVTFGDHFTLVSQDGTSTSTAVADNVGERVGSQVVLTLDTPTKLKAGQSNTLVIDFRLAEFELTGNKLTPHLAGMGPEGCQGKKRIGHITGTISGVSSTGFTLTTPGGKTLTVTTTDATTITSGQTGATVTLSDGQQVSLAGTPSTDGTTFAATAVTLLDYTSVKREEVSGTVASVDPAASSFVLTVERARGIQPTGGTITVVTDTNTHFARGRKVSTSLSDITAGISIHAEGTFDATTQTLTARSVGFAPTSTASTAPSTDKQ